MSRWDDKRYDVTSVRFYTSCVTTLYRPIILYAPLFMYWARFQARLWLKGLNCIEYMNFECVRSPAKKYFLYQTYLRKIKLHGKIMWMYLCSHVLQACDSKIWERGTKNKQLSVWLIIGKPVFKKTCDNIWLANVKKTPSEAITVWFFIRNWGFRTVTRI